jgi:hypothetical protein
VMEHQAKYYEEESTRRMAILTQVASKGVYLMVAGVLIFLIFRIFSIYLGLINPKSYGL